MEKEDRDKIGRMVGGGRWAALATIGDGIPLASMVAYAPEPGFAGFLMLLSTLSQHTRNVLANPKASLVISEPDTGAGNPQTLARVSIQGSVEPISVEAKEYAAARALYEKRFPASGPLFGFQDFTLFRLVPSEARFVGGFARAFTLSVAELRESAAR